MGIQSTDPITGKPTFNNVSSTQADFQAIADWADPSRIAAVATYARLPAAGFPGQRIQVTADPTPTSIGDYVWSGSGWLQVPRSGLVPVKASSATGGTVNADGSVSFTATASVAVDSVFSTAFDSYLIEFDQTTSTPNTNLGINERAGGVDNTSTYFWDLIYSTGSTPSGTGSASDTRVQLTAQPALYRHMRVEVINPAASAIRTMYISDDASTDTSSMGQSRGTGWHGVASAFDGFKIATLAGATITGKLRVYGIANG